MSRTRIVLSCTFCIALAACNGVDEGGSNSAEDFAERINGSKPTVEPAEPDDAPTIAAPLTSAVPAAQANQSGVVPGTMNDPQSSNCAANLMGGFIDMQADDATRSAILEAASGASSVRFVMPGSAVVQPDPTSTRLSIMIDNLGVIRDARCG